MARTRGKSKRKALKPKSKAKPAKTKAKKRAAAKPGTARASRNAVTLPALPKDLESRLLALALQMEKTMDALMLQALCEFADAWEDHFRTVRGLAEDDRIQLAVKPE
jgi:predicted transcriptional regulator